MSAIYGGIEQLVARRPHTPEVTGSSPVSAPTGVWKMRLKTVFRTPILMLLPSIISPGTMILDCFSREVGLAEKLLKSLRLPDQSPSDIGQK